MPPGMEAAARAFYEGILGIPELPKPPHLARRGGAWFERGTLKIHLGVEADFRPARKAHPALILERVEELDATAARLEGLGFAVDRAEENTFPGHRRFHTYDGHGNRVELLAGF